MRTNDIEGASPCQNKFASSCQRKTNPLEPSYKLPSLQNLNQSSQSINSSFVRDPLYIKDIEGTSAKPRNWSYQRNVDPFTEIEGSKTRQRRIFSKPNYQYNVLDINQDGVHKRNRSTNPLEPRYDIPLEKNYGYIDGTESNLKKPKILYKPRQSNNSRDIELAWVNSSNERRYFMEVQYQNSYYDISNSMTYYQQNRRQPKNPLDVSDIEGTKTEQNKSKFLTKRNLNPLVPNYIYPGQTEQLGTEELIRKPFYKHQQI